MSDLLLPPSGPPEDSIEGTVCPLRSATALAVTAAGLKVYSQSPRAIASRKWREANPERAREIARKTREKHRDINKERCRLYHERNKMKRAEYRARNRERAAAQQKANKYWRAFTTKEWKRSPLGRASYLMIVARFRAKRLGVMFSLTKDRVRKALENGHCEVTGLPFDDRGEIKRGKKSPWASTLDRTVPELGYTDVNVKVVVWAYNAAKNEYSHQIVVQMAKALLLKEST